VNCETSGRWRMNVNLAKDLTAVQMLLGLVALELSRFTVLISSWNVLTLSYSPVP